MEALKRSQKGKLEYYQALQLLYHERFQQEQLKLQQEKTHLS